MKTIARIIGITLTSASFILIGRGLYYYHLNPQKIEVLPRIFPRKAAPHHFPVQLLPAVYGDDRRIMTELRALDVVPPILHVMWKSESLPQAVLDNLHAWRRLHPSWTLVLWTDADLQRLIDRTLAGTVLGDVYAKFPKHIMRVDFARYLLLFLFGGVYADGDLQPQRSLEPLVRHHACVVAREPEPFSIAVGRPSTVLASNFLMASRPGHPLWPRIMSGVRGRNGIVTYLTGPILVTETLEAYSSELGATRREASVFLAPALYFNPPLRPQGDELHIRIMRGSGCAHFERHGTVTPFVRRVCAALRKEGRIDFSDLDRAPRHFKVAFTKHLMFGTYNAGFRPARSTTDVRRLPGLRLTPAASMTETLSATSNAFEYNRKEVRNRQ